MGSFTIGSSIVVKETRRYYVTCSCGKTMLKCKVELKVSKYLMCHKCSSPLRGTHKMSRHPLSKVYYSMRRRCGSPKDHNFKHYGGRGIVVCEEWKTIEPFLKWAINSGYQHGLTIERINNDGNYEPSNCRWATQKEQKTNHRRNRHFEINGEKMILTYWCERYNIDLGTVRYRIKKGMAILDALTTPVGAMNSNQYLKSSIKRK